MIDKHNLKTVLAIFFVGMMFGWYLPEIIHYKEHTKEVVTENTESATSTHGAMAMRNNLRDKSGDEFDKAFLEEMISHHQEAISMSQLALKNSQREEIKNLANEIIKAQAPEIKTMLDLKNSIQ